MLKRRRNARCTAVADSVLMNSRTQKILCSIVAILLSTDAATRLCARRAVQRWYLKIQDLLFQMLCRSSLYHVQFRKYRRTKLSPSFLITLYYIPSVHNNMNIANIMYAIGYIVATCFDRKRPSDKKRTFCLRYRKVLLNGIQFHLQWNVK